MNLTRTNALWCIYHEREPFLYATNSSSSLGTDLVGNQSLQTVLYGTIQPADGSDWSIRYMVSKWRMWWRGLSNIWKIEQNVSMTIFHAGRKKRIAIDSMCGTGWNCSFCICTCLLTEYGLICLSLEVMLKLTEPLRRLKVEILTGFTLRSGPIWKITHVTEVALPQRAKI